MESRPGRRLLQWLNDGSNGVKSIVFCTNWYKVKSRNKRFGPIWTIIQPSYQTSPKSNGVAIFFFFNYCTGKTLNLNDVQKGWAKKNPKNWERSFKIKKIITAVHNQLQVVFLLREGSKNLKARKYGLWPSRGSPETKSLFRPVFIVLIWRFSVKIWKILSKKTIVKVRGGRGSAEYGQRPYFCAF